MCKGRQRRRDIQSRVVRRGTGGRCTVVSEKGSQQGGRDPHHCHTVPTSETHGVVGNDQGNRDGVEMFLSREISKE